MFNDLEHLNDVSLNFVLFLTDIDECMNSPCSENGICSNTPGNYTCSCERGYKGDARKNSRGCIPVESKLTVIKFSIGNICFEI